MHSKDGAERGQRGSRDGVETVENRAVWRLLGTVVAAWVDGEGEAPVWWEEQWTGWRSADVQLARSPRPVLKVVKVVKILVVAMRKRVEEDLCDANAHEQEGRRRTDTPQQHRWPVQSAEDAAGQPLERLLRFEAERPPEGECDRITERISSLSVWASPETKSIAKTVWRKRRPLPSFA